VAAFRNGSVKVPRLYEFDLKGCWNNRFVKRDYSEFDNEEESLIKLRENTVMQSKLGKGNTRATSVIDEVAELDLVSVKTLSKSQMDNLSN